MSDDLDVETIRAACEALAQVREGLRDAHLRGFIESIDVLAEWVPALLTRCEELEATLARRRKRRQPTRTIGITDYSFVTQSKADELLRLAEARAEQAERRCEELEGDLATERQQVEQGQRDLHDAKVASGAVKIQELIDLTARAEQAERRCEELEAALKTVELRGDEWRQMGHDDAVRAERAERERDQLAAGLRLVNSVPVVTNDERHGYDCKGCGSALSTGHERECPWSIAMGVLRRSLASEDTP